MEGSGPKPAAQPNDGTYSKTETTQLVVLIDSSLLDIAF